jgi:hypothetical protein
LQQVQTKKKAPVRDGRAQVRLFCCADDVQFVRNGGGEVKTEEKTLGEILYDAFEDRLNGCDEWSKTSAKFKAEYEHAACSVMSEVEYRYVKEAEDWQKKFHGAMELAKTHMNNASDYAKERDAYLKSYEDCCQRRNELLTQNQRLKEEVAELRDAIGEPLIKEMVPFSGEKYREEALRLQNNGRKFEALFFDDIDTRGVWETFPKNINNGCFTFNDNKTQYRLLPEQAVHIPWRSIKDVPTNGWFRRLEDGDIVKLIGYQPDGQFVCFPHDGSEWVGISDLHSLYEWSRDIDSEWHPCGKEVKE